MELQLSSALCRCELWKGRRGTQWREMGERTRQGHIGLSQLLEILNSQPKAHGGLVLFWR